jgi:cell division transport system ATP-binding protein
MQLLYRINRTGTTVVVATHDHDMVDRMRRRVIELRAGKVLRDERAARYAVESTQQMDALIRGELHLPEPRARRLRPDEDLDA